MITKEDVLLAVSVIWIIAAVFVLLKPLFKRTPRKLTEKQEEPEDEGGFDNPSIVPVARDHPNLDLEHRIKHIVAQCKGIPLDDVRNDMKIGREGQTIVMSVIMNLGVSFLAVDVNTTVGGIIAMVQKQLNNHG